MIKVRVNGRECEFDADMSVEEFLLSYGFDLRFIAVEADGEILKKDLEDKREWIIQTRDRNCSLFVDDQYEIVIPDFVIIALARLLLPDIMSYYNSKDESNDFAN